jgi:hypothetical protein
MRRITGVVWLAACIVFGGWGFSVGQEGKFNGMEMNLGTLCRVSDAKTRSISAENFTGEKGRGGMADPKDKDKPNVANAANAARDLGQGWKVNPYIIIEPGKTFTLAEIDGPGAIQHIWITPDEPARFQILRMYWDGEERPSVEVPVGDFFACGLDKFAQVSSQPVAVNPASGLNCFWVMPFRKKCKITLENLMDKLSPTVYYQIDYTLTEVPADAAYFHAQFRRVNPLKYKDIVTIVDGIKGKGQYVGTYLLWQPNSNGWWGEGEIKFYMDGDQEFPTICGTGTEDYFLGSYCFKPKGTNHYQDYTSPYAGFYAHQPTGTYSANLRMGMYRWHVMDPIRFEKDLKVTIQALGGRSGGRFMPLQDDIASTAYWYQIEPHAPFPPLPDKDALEIN